MLQIVTSVPTNCDVHLTESIFQTRSSVLIACYLKHLDIISITQLLRTFYCHVDNLVSLGVTVLLFTQCLVTIVTVHSVHSNVAKIHSRLPAAMEFWLACLGILAYSCQNTSRDSDV